jgi:penicillin-binding protein 1A
VNKKEVQPSQITIAEISEARAADSTRALERRNQVLFQWLKNSNDENKCIIMRKTN